MGWMRVQQGMGSQPKVVEGPPGKWAGVSKQKSSVSTASTAASSDDENSPRQLAASFSSPQANYCPQQLQVETLPEGGIRVMWPVDARKLRSCDTHIVSPAFAFRSDVEFKLMITAASKGAKRGATGFKANGGLGKIQLKCVNDPLRSLPPYL